jgi:uncharacterized protein (TIRG00374 family)
MTSDKKNIKENLLKVFKFLIFLSIGIFLFWLVYKDQPIDQIITALKNANYFWIIVSLIISLSSHVSRALRWNILIESLGYKPRKLNTFLAVMIMYLSNTAVPRSGEITRCGIVKKYENIPFTKLLGTVVIERAVDFLMLFILMIIVLFSQFNVFVEFFKNNPGFDQKFNSIWTFKNLIILIIIAFIFMMGIFLFRKKIMNTAIYLKFKELFMNFIEGIKTIKNLEKKWLFIAHSVFIWTIYFVTIYITFWSFEFTSHLSLLTGLTIFVMASIGFVAPSPGGIGTWHFMVIETLVIYGITKNPDANAFAFAVHGSTTLFIVIIGLISLLLIPVINRKSNKIAEQ